MLKITPVQKLNLSAKMMVNSIIENSETKREYTKLFFKNANDYKLQGPAIVSYFSAVMGLNTKNFSKYKQKRLDNIINIIEKEVNSSPDLKSEATKFYNNMKKLYPKSLEKRISLASQEAVVTDEVRPRSWFKRFLMSCERFFNEEC